MADSAPTRRSSRSLPAPAPVAESEASGVSRSDLRRRSANDAPGRPSIVWGRPPAATDTVVIEIVDAESVTAEISTVETSTVESASSPAETDAATTATVEPATSDPALTVVPPVEAASAETVAPPTRRSRRVLAPAAAMSDTISPEALLAVETPFALLEPEGEPAAEALSDAATTTFTAATEPLTADPSVAAEPEASDLDEFEKAARLFSFTGETPIQNPVDAPPVKSTAPTAHSPRGRNRRAAFKKLAATSFSVGVMGLVGLVTVGMTTPAAAVAAATGTVSVASVAPAGDVQPRSEEIQAYVTPSQLENVAIQRDETYETGMLVDMAGVAGISNFSNSVFTPDPTCPIQWPFAAGVSMSYGFGMRDGVLHEGIDFTPGNGAHIQAIADGVVRISTDGGGAYGVTIVIDHTIDGVLVSSRYAHMQYGSRQVEVGDKVAVGEFIGETGDTGRSFGAHTHFEILSGGTTAIDPMPWLRQHTTC